MAREFITKAIKRRTSTPETVLIDGSNSANWSETTGTGITKTTDNTVTYDGAATTKVAIPGTTTGNIHLGTTGATVIVPPWDGDIQNQRLGAIFKCSDVSRISGMAFLIGDATFGVTLAQGSPFQYNWQNDTWIAATKGTPTWTKIGTPFPMSGAQRLRLRWIVTAGSDMNLWCAKAVMAPLARPAIVFSIDDGYAEDYTFLRGECISRNLPMSFSLDPFYIDTTNFMTTAQVRALLNDSTGLFDLNNHGYNNQHYVTDVSATQYVQNALFTRDWLRSLGVGVSANYHVWVGGQFDTAGIQLMVNAGFLAARNTSLPRYQSPYFDSSWLGSLMNIQILCGLDNTTTITQAKAYVDQCIAAGEVGFISGHKFAGAAGVLQWAQTDMQELMDHCVLRRKQGLLDVITFSQYVAGCTYGGRALAP